MSDEYRAAGPGLSTRRRRRPQAGQPLHPLRPQPHHTFGELAHAQHAHRPQTCTTHPHMYGGEPSAPARHAADVFRASGAKEVLESGAGHGRDTLHFARDGFSVHAAGFSTTGLDQLRQTANRAGLDHAVLTTAHDVPDKLPLPDASVDAVFAHMLLCMALSTQEIHALVGEVRRALRPGGTFVHTVRHTGDPHYGTGTFHGDDIFEHGGFAMHFFIRAMVDSLAEGWKLDEVYAVEEGDLPRLLRRITQSLPT